MKKSKRSRRDFLKTSLFTTTGAAIIAPTIVPSSVFGENAPSNKINIGAIGFGRISRSHDIPLTLKNHTHTSTVSR